MKNTLPENRITSDKWEPDGDNRLSFLNIQIVRPWLRSDP
jgi:hypothetical protein